MRCGAVPSSKQGLAPEEAVQIETQAWGNDAGQLLALMQGLAPQTGEAMQIEEQALVPERVNQDPSGTHLPATAWPRQMRPSTGRWWSKSMDGS